jgi:hypothetical protein
MPVIPAMREALGRRIVVRLALEKWETLPER